MWSKTLTGKELVKAVNTPTPCSCWMCRNARKDYGETIQERRFPNE